MTSKERRSEPVPRLAGLAGVLSFLFIVAGAMVLPFWLALHTADSPAAFAAYAQDQRMRIIVAMLLYSVGFGLFLVLAGALWLELWSRDSRAHHSATIFGCAAVSMATMILVAFVPACVFAYRPHSPEIAQVLWDLGFGTLAISGVPTAVCMGAYAVATLCYTTLPRWTGLVAAVGVPPHLAIAGSFMVEDGFLSLEGNATLWIPITLFAWILAASIGLIRKPGG